MRAILSRLRAALTPQALALLSVLFLLAAIAMTGNTDSSAALERRIERTLSAVEGAGRVRVVIRTSTIPTGGAAGSKETCVSGAVAVASGADDPMVCLALQEALCALLGLPPSAVTVMHGG